MKIFYFFYSIIVLFKKKYKIKVQKIVNVDQHTKTIWFNIPKNFKWQAGCSGLFGFSEAFKKIIINLEYLRYFTVARNNDKTHLEITLRAPGSNSKFKQKIMELKVGDEMILYSVKMHCPLVRRNKNLVFLSMGIGMVTYKNLFEAFEENADNVKKVTSINVDNHQTNLYHDLYTNVSKHYYPNRITFFEHLDPYYKNSDNIYYLVGSEDFLKEMIKKLKEQGINQQNIIIDRSNFLRRSYYGLKKLKLK